MADSLESHARGFAAYDQKNQFLRGAIALAVNGIPIFNPQNNGGEVSADIGELDQWGGHCGRADDYHYHVAPLHLQSVVMWQFLTVHHPISLLQAAHH